MNRSIWVDFHLQSTLPQALANWCAESYWTTLLVRARCFRRQRKKGPTPQTEKRKDICASITPRQQMTHSKVKKSPNGTASLDRKLDTIIKCLDIIAVKLLADSGLKGKDIARALGVSNPTVTKLLPLRKIKKKQ